MERDFYRKGDQQKQKNKANVPLMIMMPFVGTHVKPGLHDRIELALASSLMSH